MSVLVAGIGNLFFGDDAFGIEVARALAAAPPAGARVEDFGIRALHLAYELLEPHPMCIIADCMPRGGPPGSLYVLEPDEVAAAGSPADAHGMSVEAVFAAVRALGGTMPRTLLVGCEPASVEPGIGLSEAVARAVPEAVEMIRDLITSPPEA